MDNDKIQTIIDEHAGMIHTMADVALWKLRKPTTYDLEDLIQEARIACIKSLREYDGRIAIRSFIFHNIRCTLATLVYYSWRKKRNPDAYLREAKGRRNVSHAYSPEGVAKVREFYRSLTDEERAHMDHSLSGATKAEIREELGLSSWFQGKCLDSISRKMAPTL